MTFLAALFAILKNIIYGTTVFFTGELTATVDVLDLLALRFLLSTVVMWILKVTHVLKIKISVKDFFVRNDRSPFMKSILLAALFEPVLYMLFETIGISMTTGVTAGVILSLSAVSSCILEVVILKEKSTWMQRIFLGIGIFGAIYITLNTNTATGENSVIGIVCMFLAVLVGSLFCVFSRKSSSKFSSMEITYISCVLGAVAFNTVNVIRHIVSGTLLHYFDPYWNWQNLIGFVFLGVLSTVVATGMNNYALSKMQVSTMMAFAGISTLVTIAVGVCIQGETLHAYHIIGLVCIVVRMIGVSYIAIRRDRKKASGNVLKE